MPRNKSEVAPYRQPFLAYAKAAQEYLDNGIPVNQLSDQVNMKLSELWYAIPFSERGKMCTAVNAVQNISGNPFREACIKYIRETYGT